MTNQEILTKAIEKAIAGGWKPDDKRAGDINTVERFLEWYDVGSTSTSTNFDNYKLFIFNHDFAKALWNAEPIGEYRVSEDGKRQYMTVEDQRLWDGTTWKTHLQQMVIADDPIKYLGENL